MREEEIMTIGSNNVFADIGHPHPQEALAKARLIYRITTVVKNRGLKWKDAAKLLGISPKEFSLVVDGELLDGVTIGQLTDYLTALDEDTEIIVRDAYRPVQFRVATG
jgi:predicted XRE-type DNA-binding protein